MSAQPYYRDEFVELFLGDCRDATNWLAADVLVTDPPYGIRWRKGENRAAKSRKHNGIANDRDTTVRDAALAAWEGTRPAVVFGSFYAPYPAGYRHVLVWRKPSDAGVVGAVTGYRRDVEPIFLCGAWPQRTVLWSSLLTSMARNSGGPSSPAGRTGHPHCKPLDLMEVLIASCPPGTVADPFAGSGTTLLAAKRLGRRAIGIEINERDCELIARRLDQGVFDFGAAS